MVSGTTANEAMGADASSSQHTQSFGETKRHSRLYFCMDLGADHIVSDSCNTRGVGGGRRNTVRDAKLGTRTKGRRVKMKCLCKHSCREKREVT